MIKPRPALFKWRHFEPEIIVCAVRWYLRFSLSYRDIEELLVERGLPADHNSIWRWVQRYAPELNKRCRRELKPTNGSWLVDETYICQGGSWRYLYRAVDSTGATIDFWGYRGGRNVTCRGRSHWGSVPCASNSRSAVSKHDMPANVRGSTPECFLIWLSRK